MSSDNPFNVPKLDDSVFEKSSMVTSNFNGVDLSKASFYAVLSIAIFTIKLFILK